MTLITNFQEFEETNPLNGKITPALAESLADYFAGEQGVNEGMFDSIKNTLSKTFLGSLSYLNMIDKVRSEVLKLEKESLQKKYAFEDEIDSLRNSIKELAKSKDEVGINISNKKPFILKGLNFKSQSFELSKESKSYLNQIAVYVKENPSTKFEIGGHTDDTGGKGLNQRLSYDRAKAVYFYLLSKGVNKTRLSYEGYGSTFPIAPNTTEEGKAKNRRIELKIVK